jgi:thiamine kinase-like enzyme
MLADGASFVPAGEGALYDSLRDELARLDDGDGLPEALTHPDFVLANIVASPDRGLVAVDWTGAGRAPRMWSLGFLLYSVGAQDLRRVDLVVSGYARHVRPEPAELDRLAGIVAARPLVLGTWRFCFGRKELAAVARDVAPLRELAGAVADRARAAFGRAAAG